jgi:hypothetical protein
LGLGTSGLGGPARRGEPGSGGQGNGFVSSGGEYGGGGGGGDGNNNVYGTGAGAGGAVRIIWGLGRAFPSTRTGDL